MTFTRLRELGSGHFGTVYLERDDAMGRLCATKYLRLEDPDGRSQRINEAALMQATKHPNVVEVYQADRDNEMTFIRMEYLRRGSVLDHYLGRPIPVSRALTLISDASRGLQHLHGQGVKHRDVKPGNMLLTDTGTLKISDFGLAAKIDDLTAMPLVYEPHLSPEEVSNPDSSGSVSADIYALGVSSYRMLNGERLFWDVVSEQTNVTDAIKKGLVPDRNRWLPHVHEPLRRVIRKAINPEPKHRYSSVVDFRHAIEKTNPIVSWSLESEPGRMQWTGFNSNDSIWVAELTLTDAGAAFTIQKKGATGKYRRSASSCYAGDDLRLALDRANTVLGSVAMGKRLT